MLEINRRRMGFWTIRTQPLMKEEEAENWEKDINVFCENHGPLLTQVFHFSVGCQKLVGI
ncbi:hypothetical protein [Evansella clarkii]|uniref:hypothetical protein n=1 Tax=Evansella clarkii TaxID=79879 RepID=UPI001ADD1ECC|nr:hypothetical protein [Evansella clarkii]